MPGDVACGIYRGAHRKKISGSAEKSAAAVGTGEDGRQEDPYNTGEKSESGGSGYIIKAYFGDALLYVCYEFYDRFKNKPKDWMEVFDFLRFMKVQGILKEIAMDIVRAGENG
jgi:hypothetical protein